MNTNQVLIFSHLQRTGGNSLRELLAANFGADATIRGAAFPVGNYIQKFMAGRVRAVEGMFPYGAHEHLCPNGAYSYFTFMREPLARWISYYNFCLVHPSAGLHTLATKHSFHDFLLHPKRPRNAAARIIVGHGTEPDDSLVRSSLDRFSFIGVQERFVDSTFVLCRIFGLPFPFIGYVGRLAGKSPGHDQGPAPRLPAEDIVDLSLHGTACSLLDRTIAAMHATDREALELVRHVIEHASTTPELSAVLDQIRKAGTPARKTVDALHTSLRGLSSRHAEWGNKVTRVLDHFASHAAEPGLWLDQLGSITGQSAARARTDGHRPKGPLPSTRDARPAAIGVEGPVVAPAAGHHAYTLRIECLPALPERAIFLEHHDRAPEGASETVAAAGKDLWISADGGENWRKVRLRGPANRPVRCFTTRHGTRLLQMSDDSRVHAYDAAGCLKGISGAERAGVHWHGTWSIDQSATNAICWAEYIGRAEDVAVYRSADDGISWQRVMDVDGRAGGPGSIRHFHMVLADPYSPGRWYLSSGDRGEECRFWISADDALSWTDIGTPNIVNPGDYDFGASTHKIFRTTSCVIRKDWIYWCTDDLIDGRGPLYVRMGKMAPYPIEILGRVGTQHIRALVTHDDDTFIAISQGNRGSSSVTAHYLHTTGKIAELISLPKPTDIHTSFCRSLSSRSTVGGIFFTAGGGQVIDPRPRLWRWRLARA